MEIQITKEVKEFIASLEDTTIIKIFKTIELLEVYGNKLRLPHSRAIERGLFELRIRGHQEIRLFYVYHKNRAVLLHGFIKKSFRIPKKELNIALNKLKGLTSLNGVDAI